MKDDFLLEQVLHYFNEKREHIGLSQIISLSACDITFAAQLLADPAAALANMPPDVQLSLEEFFLIMSVHGASDIYEFAALLLEKIGAAAPHRGPCDDSNPEFSL